MIVDNEVKLDYDDVLLVPQKTNSVSRKEVNIERTFKFYHSPRTWTGVPIMAANMYATGTFAMSDALWKEKMVTCLHKYNNFEKLIEWFGYTSSYHEQGIENNCWLSMGLDRDILDKLYSSIGYVPNLCIDVANGYSDKFLDFCKEIRDDYPQAIIMAGNICTSEMVHELIRHGGVDIVKVGIGPGAVCTTRLKTGCGVPQFSAVSDCAHAAHGLKSDEKRLGLICADGGCKNPGDVCKAFAANADFVMLGGMLAGTDECDGTWDYYGIINGVVGKIVPCKKKSLTFYGMSSKEAQEKHGNGLKKYRASEGRCVKVPYKGPVRDIIQDITGGLRSSCSYIGATSIKDMAKCAKFVRVNNTHNRTFE